MRGFADDVEQLCGRQPRNGFAGEVGPKWMLNTVACPQLGLDEQTVLSYARRVPVSLLKESVLNGTPEEVIEQAAEWRDHGLRYLVAGNVSILQPSLRKGLAASAPFFKILRGLKKL